MIFTFGKIRGGKKVTLIKGYPTVTEHAQTFPTGTQRPAYTLYTNKKKSGMGDLIKGKVAVVSKSEQFPCGELSGLWASNLTNRVGPIGPNQVRAVRVGLYTNMAEL